MNKKFEQFLGTIRLSEDMELPYFGNFKTYVHEDEREFYMARYLSFLETQLNLFRMSARKTGSLESFQQFLDRTYPDRNIIYPIEEVEI